MRVLVCGSRDYSDRVRMFRILDELGTEAVQRDDHITLIHGCARGADSIAAEWATHASPVTVEEYPAEWAKYGKRAGFLRNRRMLEEGRPELVLAFFSSAERSRGTSMMVEIARAAGVRVLEWVP